MIAVVDYGVGNLFSLKSSIAYIGKEAVVTAEPGEIARADRIILPGVGAFEDAAARLRRSGLDRVICKEAGEGKPLLGICLGMQLLFDESYEYGCHKGLGLIPGKVVPLEGKVPGGYKIPHIGWNALSFPAKKSKLFKNTDSGDYVYFVHSYYAEAEEQYISASAEYGIIVTAAAEKGNVYGTQFHPEKSGETGLGILKAFCEI